VVTAETTSSETTPEGSPRHQEAAGSTGNGKPRRVEPDLDFIRSLNRQGGDALKKCLQCGTCSSTCDASPDSAPFPRKEMAWAVWGLKDRLVADPDAWLCYHCNDCTARCPRGVRPGDVMGAIRQECVAHYATPSILAKWAGQPQCIPLLLGIPAALLALTLRLKTPIENALNLGGSAAPETGAPIVYSYSPMLPHWLLNMLFGLLALFVLLVAVGSVWQFWRGMKAADAARGTGAPVKTVWASLAAALGGVFTHRRFIDCTETRWRYYSHISVFFGFLALCLVTLWVITIDINPLIRDELIYPLGFWNPWKLLANAGGLAVLIGCSFMCIDRLRGDEPAWGSYADWTLLVTLMLVVLTGFFAEFSHFIRLEPHRHIAYFVHLIFAFALLLYLPYSKLAHLFLRVTAMVYAEHTGRNAAAPPVVESKNENALSEEETHVPESTG